MRKVKRTIQYLCYLRNHIRRGLLLKNLLLFQILHVLGSPSDEFSFKLNMLYGGSFPEEMQSPKHDYCFVYALVRPAGSWSFAERLSDIVDLTKLEERGNSLKKMDITAALQHIKHVIQPDMALLHFVCLKGMTTYRSDLLLRGLLVSI